MFQRSKQLIEKQLTQQPRESLLTSNWSALAGHQMKPRAVLKHHSNSFPFEERTLDLTGQIKVGRAVAKCKPTEDNAIFDCKVLSRNHAVIWFENGRFYIKDTSSSNGTYINNTRLTPANEVSPGKEIHSNDIIQFGVEVIDTNSKVTHNCIIIKIKLYYPNGSEASRESSMFNIPTINMLPAHFSYTQMMEKERQVFDKLHSIEEILEEAHLLADMTLNAKKQNEQLLTQMNELQLTCDEKEKLAQELQQKIDNLEDELEKINSQREYDTEMISLLEDRVKDKENEIGNLHKKLDKMIRQDHRLVTILFLLLIIILVVGGFDMIITITRLVIP